MKIIEMIDKPNSNTVPRRPPTYLTEEEICEALVVELSASLDEKTDEWRTKISTELLEVFKDWKLEIGSRTPRGWRDRPGRRGLGARKPIEFSIALPYECGEDESGIVDYVTLLINLAHANYPRAQPLFDNEDFDNLIALAAMISPQTVKLNSLLDATRICRVLSKRRSKNSQDREQSFAQVLIETAPERKLGKKTKTNLAKGPTVSAKRKSTSTIANTKRWREAARILIADGTKLDDAAEAIRNNTLQNPAGKSFRTIRDAIQRLDKPD